MRMPDSAILMAAVHLYKQVPEDERGNPHFAAEHRKQAARQAILMAAEMEEQINEWASMGGVRRDALLHPPMKPSK